MVSEIEKKNVPSSQMEYFYKNETGGRSTWVKITKKMMYLSYPSGRTVYLFTSPDAKIPKITFNDSTLIIRIGSNHKLKFYSEKLYEKTKKIMMAWMH